jgi:hypothetical protein
MKNTNNMNLLNQANTSNLWLHYKKTKPVLAKELKASETIETHEGEITYNAGDYLCKGPSGDIWGQKADSLFKKYGPARGSKPDKDGWQEFLPKPEASGVMAAQIDHDFSVEHPSWGTFYGKAGGYLVKSYEDKDTEFPEDIWIVKKEIFESTYERV